MSATEAQLHEIFCSVQGEGIYVGERQIFVRFLMCNLSCPYCDSQDCLVPQKTFRVEETPGKRDFKQHNNPATVDQIIVLLDPYIKQKDLIHSVSLTGGEPLLQVDFLKNLIPALKGKGLKTYLETNGTMPDRLKEIAPMVDIISMDFKLQSMSGASDMIAENKKALEAAKGSQVFIKIVVGKPTKPIEIENASKAISDVDPETPLVIQPVTPVREIKHGPSPEQVLSFQAIAKRHLSNVRVIPQTHKLMGQA